jgi:hypothetical protein
MAHPKAACSLRRHVCGSPWRRTTSPEKGSARISLRVARRCRSLAGTRASGLPARFATRSVQNTEKLVVGHELAATDLGPALPDAGKFGLGWLGKRVAVGDVGAEGLPDEFGARPVLFSVDLVDLRGHRRRHRDTEGVTRAHAYVGITKCYPTVYGRRDVRSNRGAARVELPRRANLNQATAAALDSNRS